MTNQDVQRIGFACKYMHPDQTQKKKLLEEIQRPLNTRSTTVQWLNRQTKEVFNIGGKQVPGVMADFIQKNKKDLYIWGLLYICRYKLFINQMTYFCKSKSIKKSCYQIK